MFCSTFFQYRISATCCKNGRKRLSNVNVSSYAQASQIGAYSLTTKKQSSTKVCFFPSLVVLLLM